MQVPPPPRMMPSEGSVKARQAIAAIEDPKATSEQIINELFPSESSLAHLDDCIMVLQEAYDELDSQIATALQDRAAALDEDDRDWQRLNEGVDALMEGVAVTASKVLTTKDWTDDVGEDVKLLDTAKDNLSATVTAIEKLLMLKTACDRLTEAMTQRDYGTCAEMVAAAESLGSYFVESGIAGVPKIAKILSEKEGLVADVRKQLDEDWDTLCDDPSAAIDGLACCRLSAALGLEHRRQMVSYFCSRLLDPYRQNYALVLTTGASRQQDAVHGLETVDRRFFWLRKALKDAEDVLPKLFLPEWGLPYHIAAHWVLLTRQQLVDLLEAAADQLNPKFLVSTILKVRTFEKQLDALVLPTAGPGSYMGVDMLHTFEGAVTSVFDSFLGGWYRQKDKEVRNFIVSVLAGGNDSETLLSEGSDTATVDDDLPKKIFTSAITMFRLLRDIASEARSTASHQMGRDATKLVTFAAHRYIVWLGNDGLGLMTGLVEPQDENAPTASHILHNIVALPRIGDLEKDSSGITSGGSRTASRSSKNRVATTLDVERLCVAVATLHFVETSLPALSALLHETDIDDDKGVLREELELAWKFRVKLVEGLLSYFVAKVISDEIVKGMRQALSSTVTHTNSRWISDVMNNWETFHGILQSALCAQQVYFLLAVCAVLFASLAIKVLACDLAPITSSSATEQLMFDFNAIIDSLPKRFSSGGKGQIPVPVAAAQQQLTVVLNIFKVLLACQTRPSLGDGGHSKLGGGSQSADGLASRKFSWITDTSAELKLLWHELNERHQAAPPVGAIYLCSLKPSHTDYSDTNAEPSIPGGASCFTAGMGSHVVDRIQALRQEKFDPIPTSGAPSAAWLLSPPRPGSGL